MARKKMDKPVVTIFEELLPLVKSNLIIDYDRDDALLTRIIRSAVDCAERYQNIERETYRALCDMPPTARQAVIMLASHWYESRDGSTGGFFGDRTQAADAVMTAVNRLLTLDRRVAL